MAKIGGPPLPPVGIPRPRTEQGGDAKPAATPQQTPGAKGGPPAPAANPQVQAQQVVQQFGSAFASAGKLASQLMKGLGTPAPAQQRRSEKKEESSEAKGGQQSEGEHGAEEAGDNNPLSNAFAALKQSRLFRFRKTRRKQSGKAGQAERLETTGIVLEDDDYNEKEREHHKARDYLVGEEQEQTSFGQARREALFMQHLENQGAPPSNIARHLNSQLGSSRDQEFKHLLSDQVRPQMEAMASKVSQVPVDERRTLAALVSRAAYQVGTQGSGTFEKLLTAAGTAEAEQLAAPTEAVDERAEQIKQALQRAASPAYRAALVEAARGSLEQLAAGTVGLPPEERQRTWVSLLRSTETLRPESHAVLAEAVVTGVLGTKRPNAAETLAEALGPALRTVPGGGSWVVQLIVTLSARGEPQASERLAAAVHEVIHEARQNCIPVFKQLRDIKGRPSNGTANEEKVLRELEAVGPPLVSLIPACSQVLERGSALPPGAASLMTEALMALASLDLLGPTAAGQKLFRQALLSQERDGQTFLPTLPKVARTLAQPQLVRSVIEGGLVAASYLSGGQRFLEHVATYTCQALAAPVRARSQKGDASSARALLRSGIRNNAVLFGLTPDGARVAADAIEALREKPSPMALQRTLIVLEKIRAQHPLPNAILTVEPLKAVATALGERAGPLVPMQGHGTGSRPALHLTRLEIAMDQAALLRQQNASREPPAAEPKPAPAGPPGPARGRK